MASDFSKVNDNPTLEEALTLASLGWRVIPLHTVKDGRCSCGKDPCPDKPGKHPRTAHGSKDGTTAATAIRAWWKRWRTANLAVCTGQESGVWVLGPDGIAGIEALAELVREHGGLPRTPTARSGSGGRHNYFRWPADGNITNRRNHRGLPIDVRGEGGYAVAPPSCNIGGPYAWEIHPAECEPAEAPAWLLEWCRTAERPGGNPPPAPSPPRMTAANGLSVAERAIRYLSRMPPAISGQGGHGATMAAARVVVHGFDLGPGAGFQLLWEQYNPRCEPPWSEKELRHKCEEADTKPYGKPRGWLLEKEEPPGQVGTPPATDPPPWEPPLALVDVPAVEPFPVDVLPAAVVRFVEDVAAALPCPPDYVAVPALVIAGGAVGASRCLQIKPGWRERPCVYAGVVAPPGSAKTPAQKIVASPVYAEQARLHALYTRERDAYEAGATEAKPKERAAYVGDATVEKIADLLQGIPRGLVMIRDELVAWTLGMNQYRARGAGADRQFYLSVWAGEPVSVHRKSQQAGPLFVSDPFLSVVGGLPPDVLPQLRGEREISDGFMDRILFSYPVPPQAVGEDWCCVDDEAVEGWKGVLEKLWKMEPEKTEEGGTRPRFVRLTTCGRHEWERFTRGLAAEMNAEDFLEHLRGPWAKLRGYCARLALIVHMLRVAAGETEDQEVDGESVGRATRLVTYFQSHARKVHACVGADPRIPRAKTVLNWLRREKLTEFTKRAAHYALSGTFKTAEDLEPPLALLTQHGFIRPRSQADRPGPGRKPSPAYEVNPLWKH
jgi:hypothetical protein